MARAGDHGLERLADDVACFRMLFRSHPCLRCLLFSDAELLSLTSGGLARCQYSKFSVIAAIRRSADTQTGATGVALSGDLLRLIAAGHTNAQIARRLGISEGTVRTHLANIYERLKVSSRTAAIAHVFVGRIM